MIIIGYGRYETISKQTQSLYNRRTGYVMPERRP